MTEFGSVIVPHSAPGGRKARPSRSCPVRSGRVPSGLLASVPLFPGLFQSEEGSSCYTPRGTGAKHERTEGYPKFGDLRNKSCGRKCDAGFAQIEGPAEEARFVGFGDDGVPVATVIEGYGGVKGVWIAQEFRERDPENEPAIGIPGNQVRGAEEVLLSLDAMCEEEHPVPRRRVVASSTMPFGEDGVLQTFVEADLPLQVLAMVLRPYGLGSVIEFEEEVEFPAVSGLELHGSVGFQLVGSERKEHGILAAVVSEVEDGRFRSHHGLDDDFGEPPRMLLAGRRHGHEEGLVRERSIAAVEQAKAFGRQAVPACGKGARRGHDCGAHEAAVAQGLHPFADSAEILEGLGEGQTRFEDEGSRGRCAVEEAKDLGVAAFEDQAGLGHLPFCSWERNMPGQLLPIGMGKAFIDVDRLQAETTLEEAAAKCGVTLDIRQSGKEARIDCPFGCAGDHAGKKEIAVNTEHPQKVFYCHAYQCGFRGNLLMLMHGWLTGKKPTGGRLTGEEFNRAKQVLAAKTAADRPAATGTPLQEERERPAEVQKRNTPLAESENEGARGLVDIDAKFVVEAASMSPSASAYVRRRPFLTPELMGKWRVGYLPSDGGGDKRGWSLRGCILYPLLSIDGKLLGWIGRDPQYEEKLSEWEGSDRRSPPPSKHRFPKGLQRGIEFFGQQGSRLKEPGYRDVIERQGLLVVGSFNDVLALDALGIPAIGLMGESITEEQVAKLALWARRLARGRVSLMLPCNAAGDSAAKEAAWELLERGVDVRLAWSQAMHRERFRGREPESLQAEEWKGVIEGALQR